MIDGGNFFDQPIKNDQRTCDSIQKIAIGQGDDYATGCLLDYPYFKERKLIVLDLSKQQELVMLIWKQFIKRILLKI